MKPAFNVRQQSEIFIGPLADILSGVLPEGRVVVVSDSTIDRLYHSVLAQYDTVLIGLGESVKTMQTVEMIYRRFIELAWTVRPSCWRSGAASSPTWRDSPHRPTCAA